MKSSRAFVALAWFIVGCRAGGAPDAPRPDERARLIAEADRLIEASQVLDYRAPQEDVREAVQDQGIARYAQACQLGDARACWRAATIPTSRSSDTAPPVITQVGEHCLAGDAMSCRGVAAVGADYDLFIDAPGLCRRGLGVACDATAREIAAGRIEGDADATFTAGCEHGDLDACIAVAARAQERGADAATVAVLQERARVVAVAQCKAGVPMACLSFSSSSVTPFAPVEGFEALALTGARDGCRQGLVGDCYVVYYVGKDPAERDAALLIQCATQGQLCEPLIELRGAGTVGGRDAAEHACQRRDHALCAALVKGYRAQRWPEPVPGRAAAITAWLCEDPQAEWCRKLDE